MNVVIGAGITGLSAAQALRGETLVLERDGRPGGLSGRYRAGGFAFDYGGHYFHFQDKPEVRRHVESFRSFRRFRRDSRVLLLGRAIPYSLQYHLAYLPAPLRRAVVAEILAAPIGRGGDESLEEFLLNHFGPRLVELFFAPFLGKFYGRPLSRLIAGMDKGSIPLPGRQQVLAGASRRRQFAEGYNPVFYYPRGGLQAFADDYAGPLASSIRYGEEVVAIEPGRRRVITAAGSHPYENLISTMPLNRLLQALRPQADAAGRRLRHLSTLVVNAVLARRRRRCHWLYLPEKRFPFYRAGYYPADGTVAVYLERTIAPGLLLERRRLLDETLFTLRETGMIAADKELIFHDAKVIPVSYVVFDRAWPRLVPAALERLRRLNIYSIGRYGGWNYTSMADDIRQGRETAQRLNEA